jgi:hypothetical protein
MNSASGQVLWRNKSKLHPKASKPTSKSLFGNLAPLSQKSKLEDFMQDYFFFFKKIIIVTLKYKLSI